MTRQVSIWIEYRNAASHHPLQPAVACGSATKSGMGRATFPQCVGAIECIRSRPVLRFCDLRCTMSKVTRGLQRANSIPPSLVACCYYARPDPWDLAAQCNARCCCALIDCDPISWIVGCGMWKVALLLQLDVRAKANMREMSMYLVYVLCMNV